MGQSEFYLVPLVHFWHDSLVLDLFPRSKVFERSGRCPLSNGNVPRGRLLAICIFCARRMHELYYLCAICIIHVRSVMFPACDQCTNHSLFVCDLCAICVSFCTPCAHDVFLGPGFEPLHFQRNHFVGPGFSVRPVKSLAYITKLLIMWFFWFEKILKE